MTPRDVPLTAVIIPAGRDAGMPCIRTALGAVGADQPHDGGAIVLDAAKYRAAVDPAVHAAEQTAQYTLVLAVATFLLFLATAVALCVGELQRRTGIAQAEKARVLQYEHDTKLSDANIAEWRRDRDLRVAQRSEDRELRRSAGIAQLVTIVDSYERAVALLLADPNHPISPYARTMETLFAHAISDEITAAIPVELRSATLTAIVTAQETLQRAVDNQRIHEECVAGLDRDRVVSMRFAERLRAAREELEHLEREKRSCFDALQHSVLSERLIEGKRRLSELNTSVEAYEAHRYEETKESRNVEASSLLSANKEYAESARAVLYSTRSMLAEIGTVSTVHVNAGPLGDLEKKSPA